MRLIRGESAPKEAVLLGHPRGLVRRQSTDVLAVEDEELEKALRYIREHACEGIRVSDVAAQTGHSPSTLECRIKAMLGRSIKSEIARVRLERVKLLLQLFHEVGSENRRRCDTDRVRRIEVLVPGFLR